MDNVHKIFGAPGCGKTTKLMSILLKELEHTAPNRIAFVSFTRKGTYEGAERAKSMYNLRDEDMPYFRTLHSIAFRAGDYAKSDMLSKSDYKAFSDSMDMKFTGYYTEDFYNNDDKYLFTHFMKRNNPRAASAFANDLNAHVLRDVEYNFTRYKDFTKKHDFTDIIERFVEAGEALPVDVAIIDEAQDLTTLQWRMCEVAFKNCRTIYVAGDDDQAIYEWSGADVDYFLRLNASTQEVLDKSYRLQRKILVLAKRVSGMISRRVEKNFEPVGDEGDVHFYNSLDDLPLNATESWYFLSRNNFFLAPYREYLRGKARVYTDKDELSYSQREIDAINAYEAGRKRGKYTDIEEVRLKLFLKDGADMTRPWYDSLKLTNDAIAYYRDLIRTRANLRDRSLTVSTIHGVKGGEADNVVLTLDFTKAVRNNMERNPDSELRCLYVAITRAKKHLHIVHASSKNGYDDFVRLHA